MINISNELLCDSRINLAALIGAQLASKEDKEFRATSFRLVRRQVRRGKVRQWVELLVDGFWVRA